MLRELFAQQQHSLNHFFAHVDLIKAEQIVEECLACEGLIFLVGVGKSGLVAEKIALTLTSTGTRALFLPPGNLLHGDLGVITEKDLVILLSRSGETKELLDLIPFIRQKKAKIISCVCRMPCRIGAQADLAMELPLHKELCPFDLAPTTSTVLQLIFGEVLAVALMRKKNISLEQYAHNHPAGSIGKKATLLVKDIMLKEERVPTCFASDLLIDQLVELSNKKCGCLLITDENKKLLGIFTDGDLRRALQTYGSTVLHRPIGELMNCSASSIAPNKKAIDAVSEMQKDPKKWIMVLPVLDKEKIIGLVRLHDIIQEGIA